MGIWKGGHNNRGKQGDIFLSLGEAKVSEMPGGYPVHLFSRCASEMSFPFLFSSRN